MSKEHKPYKLEEAILRNMIDKRLYILDQDKSLTFKDGLSVAFFVVNAISWIRTHRRMEAGIEISEYYKKEYDECEKLRKQYGFPGYDKIIENTIYSKEYTLKETNE